MQRARRYFLNALILSACMLLMRTVAVAFNAFCVQKVGGEGMGLFSLVMSVYTFAVTLATSGVNLAATRLVALYFGRDEGAGVKSAMCKCLLYSLFFGTLAGVGLFCFADFVSDHFLMEPRAAMSVRALSLSLLPLSLCSAFSGYFAAVRRVYKNAIAQVAEQTVKILACTFLLSIYVPRGIEYACLALVLGGSISEIFSFLIQICAYLADKRTLRGGGKPVKLSTVLHISMPVALSAYVRSGLVTLEHILIPIGLAAYGDESALATYGVVCAVALPILLYPSAFVGAFAGQVIPEITELYAAENQKEVTYVTSRAFSVTLFFSILCAGMFAAFAGDLCKAIYGSGEAAEYLRVLAQLAPVMFLDTVTDSILKGLGKQFYTMCVNIADAAISALLVWVLVPRIGVYGYILVICVSECINTVCSIGKLLSMVPLRFRIGKWLLAPLLAAVGAANAVCLLLRLLAIDFSVGRTLLECLLYCLCYLLFAMLLGAIGREELSFVRGLLGKKETKRKPKTAACRQSL